jgi:hypothetical protein
MTELKQQDQRIRFEDLWYVSQPGDLAYSQPSRLKGYWNGEAPTYQSIQRVHALRDAIGKYQRGGPSGLAYDAVANHGRMVYPNRDPLTVS